MSRSIAGKIKLNSFADIVGGDDMHLFGLGAGQGADQARGGQQERQFPSHLAGFI